MMKVKNEPQISKSFIPQSVLDTWLANEEPDAIPIDVQPVENQLKRGESNLSM
jgi:hypothetical protein